MSSLLRRIEHQIVSSKPNGKGETNPPRGKFFGGRGSKLGVKNPKAKDLLVRIAREAKRRTKGCAL